MQPDIVRRDDREAAPFVALRIGLRQLTGQHFEPGPGLLGSHTRSQPSFDQQIARAAIIEQIVGRGERRVRVEGNPELRGEAHQEPLELRRQHADDLERPAPYPQRLPQHPRIGGEAALPQAAADHDHRRRAQLIVFPSDERSPD